MGNNNFKKEVIDETKGFYHLRIREVLNNLVRKHSRLKRHKQTFKLTSTKTRSRSISEYRPDYSIKIELKPRVYAKIIFEFIDKQSDIKTMADLSRTILAENCQKIILIVNNKNKHKMTEEIADIFINGIKSLFESKSENKISKEDVLDYANLHIPISMTDDKIENKIIEEISKITKIK